MYLINPEDIRFDKVPIAPVLVEDSVHYEWVAFRWKVIRIPIIEAEPVKRAHWIDQKHGVYKCSNCGNFLDFSGVNAGRGDANYCPNCGADMRGEQDDESRSNSNAQTDTRARGMGATDKSSGI